MALKISGISKAFTLLGALVLSSVVHAEAPVVTPGTVAECIPSPSVEAINSASMFRGENPELVQLITCDVIEGQPLPSKSRLVGELRAVAPLGPYSIVWKKFQLRSDKGDLVWSISDENAVSSVIQESGALRVTFK